MKNIYFTLFIVFAFSFVSGQDKNSMIKNIDKKVMTISQERNYQIVILKNEEFLDTAFIKQAGKGYGQLTGYLKNNTIFKIRELIGISQMHDKAITEYFFSEGKLIYVSETENYGPAVMVDSTGTRDFKKENADFEGQYYFADDKLINSKTSGQPQILPNEMYFDSQSKEGQLLLSAEKYVALLKKKKK